MFKKPLAGNEELYRAASPRWRITPTRLRS